MKGLSQYLEIIARIQAVTHTRTQDELATILNVRQSSIADAKKRQSIPADWYIKLFEKLGINPDWLKKGTGPIYLRTEAGYIPGDGEGTSIARIYWGRLWHSRRSPPYTPCAGSTRRMSHPRLCFSRQARSLYLNFMRGKKLSFWKWTAKPPPRQFVGARMSASTHSPITPRAGNCSRFYFPMRELP